MLVVYVQIVKKMIYLWRRTVVKIVKPCNRRTTRFDENKLRNKARNLIGLQNGEEIETENAEELNSKVIKAERSSKLLRSVTEQYQTLYNSYQYIGEEELEEIGTERLERFRSNLAANLR
jgi:hypothetical protein